jgi:LuxR family maltose regulon positive regulatory protein
MGTDSAELVCLRLHGACLVMAGRGSARRRAGERPVTPAQLPVRTSPASPSSDGAVRAALDRRDLRAIEDLSDQLWYQLPARHARQLLDVLAQVPPLQLSERPRLLVTGLLAHRFLHADDVAEVRRVERAYAVHGARHERRVADFASAADAVAAGVLAMQAARWRRDHAAAERVAAITEARAQELEAAGPVVWSLAGARRRPGLVALQRGVNRVVADDVDGAVGHLERAYAQAGPAPFQHFAGAAACATLAMLAAERGHHRLAVTWLERLAALGPVPPWLDHLLTGAAVAEALLAIDHLDRPAAERALARAGDGADATDLWPHVTAAWTAFDLTFNGPVDGLVRLDAASFAHGQGRRPRLGDPAVLLRAFADLLVVSGEGNYALSVLGDVSRRPDLAPAAAAVHVRAQQNYRAIAVAARALRDPAASPRDLVELSLVLAVAHLRDDDPDNAVIAFRRALDLRAHGIRRPFVAVPSAILAELCRLTGTDPAMLGIPDDPRPEPPTTAQTLSLVTLTARELEVLRALAGGGSTSVVAHRLHVSTNTVRTHVKSLYRKLGVQRRDAALARAAELGLLVGE